MEKHTLKTFFMNIFNTIKRILVLLIYDISQLSVRDQNLIVFGSQNGKSIGDNPKYLYEAIKKRGRYRLIWVLKDKESVVKSRALGYDCYYHRSLKGVYYQLRAKYFIHSHSINNDFSSMFLGGATSIDTWHGAGIKKLWAANRNTYSYKALHEPNRLKRHIMLQFCKFTQAKENYIMSTGPGTTSYYPETFMLKPEEVLELGQARNDVFFEDENINNNYIDYIKGHKTILYMPTHRNDGKSDIYMDQIIDFDVLEKFCNENKYKFLIKSHIYGNIAVDNNYADIIDVSEWDIDAQLLLKYADILVTDYSSCYADFLMLDRPIIFYCYDYHEYIESDREMYFEYNDVTPGDKVTTFQQLMISLKLTVDGKDDYVAERKRVLNIFYSPENQQKVAEKQVDYIINNIIK
ncbi:CDP-glycerol glycerophosphotransferase family protein [Clostridium oryzae]|uniref:CDP-glycerol:poly(Glycerophosphate) glycerophosphotransferase n=1 Tax=Clostridium oryzae TaxID=1450648 RepID=A0A1V4IYB5_9CLOT|nr:CDP-glycerol glycerophosphotransferase family protein [Clostridium oryzae]OPJ65058.1 CDP-glycerol:poly(glycerophosphate) glycerophosphotransferase [Clostridium oryzae]